MRTTARRSQFTILTFIAVALASTVAMLRASPPAQDQEQQIGQEVFHELKLKGEIVSSSPLYEVLTPIADAVTRTAQPRYNHPFKFYLVHEQQPNAFATPGGNVYVTDALLYFVKNTEQLAGTLCHEVSHTIHHDSMNLLEKDQKLEKRALGAAILLGPSTAHLLAIALIGKLHSLSYSREAESAADLTGSDICAASGYNPWGLVWLFEDFAAAEDVPVPQLLSDHPDNPHRVQALKQHFRANPKAFASYSSDPKTARPFVAPKNAPESFLR
jgi:beta-barrel assembly-enhancing protease